MANRPAVVCLTLALPSLALVAQETPEQMFMRAREMQQSSGGDDPQGAVALYRKVAAALPKSMEAHLRLSEALVEVEDVDGALAEAKKATALAPRSAEAATHMAVIEYAVAKQQGGKGNATKAAKTAETAKAALLQATKLSPADTELWFRLADICESTLDAPGALHAWLRLGHIRPQMQMGEKPLYVVAFERAAYLANQLKRYNERREACLALLREPRPAEHHLQLLEELARDQVQQGYLGHAEESFTLLAKLLPHEPAVWQNVALVQRRADRFEDAAKSLMKAQDVKPDPQNVVQYAYCLMNMGELTQSKDILVGLLDQPDFLRQGGSAQQVQPLLSACMLMLDAPHDLLELMDRWDNVAESGFLSSHRATALIRAGSVAAACSAIKDGAKRFPDHLPFRRATSMPLGMGEGAPYDAKAAADIKRAGLESSAYLAAEFRQWEKCLGAIDEMHGISPIGDVELLLLKSNALELLGRRDEALKVLRECHSLEPGHPTVQNNLGYHLLELDGDVLEASSLISAALAQEPDNASYMDSWGWALFKQGKFKEAEVALRKAVEANPLSPEIRKHLGEALIKLDRPQEALEQWERALAFASADRKGLEGRVSKLRTDLAKKALEEIGPGRTELDSDLDSDSDSDDDDDDGWVP